MELEKKQLLILQNIFRDVFNNHSLVINEKTNSGDIEEWDSINNINILIQIEKEFGIKFDLMEFSTFNNINDILTAINTLKC